MHDGKVRFDTVEYTTAFLYSDWLFFLWHGINTIILYYQYFDVHTNLPLFANPAKIKKVKKSSNQVTT